MGEPWEIPSENPLLLKHAVWRTTWENLARTLATLAENPLDVPPREGEPLGRTLGAPWEKLGNFNRESDRRVTKRGRTDWENLGRTSGEPRQP